MGMIEGFFWSLKVLILFFVCVGKNLASIFIGGLIKEGIFRGITDIGCIVLGIKHNQRKCSWVSD